MSKAEIKIGDRLYHAIFGWCKVTHPPLPDKCLVDLEADEIEYYLMGEGRVSHKRDSNGIHTLFTPIDQLFKTKEEAESIPLLNLKKEAYSPKLTFWNGNNQ